MILAFREQHRFTILRTIFSTKEHQEAATGASSPLIGSSESDFLKREWEVICGGKKLGVVAYGYRRVPSALTLESICD